MGGRGHHLVRALGRLGLCGADPETVEVALSDVRSSLGPGAGSQLVASALTHGLAEPLYVGLRDADVAGFLDEDAWNALRASYLKTSVENAARLERLERLERSLARAGVRHVRLKGVALLGEVYGDPGLRPMSDIDLLVSRDDVSRAVRALAPLGYAPADPRELDPDSVRGRRTYHVQLAGHTAEAEPLVELHWDLTQPDGLLRSLRLDIPAILEARHGVRSSPEDSIVILSIHLARHYFRGLMWLADIALLLRRYSDSVRWDQLWSRAEAAGALTVVFATLQATERVFGVRAPPVPHEGAGGPGRLRRAALDVLLAPERLLETTQGPRGLKLLLPDRYRDCIDTALWAGWFRLAGASSS